MEKLKTLDTLRNMWYSVVALPLKKELQSYKDHYQTMLDAYITQTRELNKTKLDLLTAKNEVLEWKQRAMIENRDGAVAVQVIRERMRGGEMQSVLSARDQAAKQRINELECEIYSLRKQLRERN